MSAMPFLSMNMDRSKLFTVISIILFSFLLYGNTVFNDYALDDELVITKNKFTQMGIKGIKGIFSYDYFKGYDESYSARVYGGRYRPISMASFAVENELFGKNPEDQKQ